MSHLEEEHVFVSQRSTGRRVPGGLRVYSEGFDLVRVVREGFSEKVTSLRRGVDVS